MEDKDLVHLSQKGDDEAFGMLVSKYKTKVFNLAYSVTQNQEMADDLAQEIFIKTYMAVPKFRFKSQFGTWLYRISVNHIRDFLRKKGKMKEISLEDVSESRIPHDNEALKREKETENEQRRTLVFKVIETLPEKYRVILTLRDIQGIPYGEIANILKISPGTVDSRLHRARKILRKKISPFLLKEGGSHEM
jgi:RNA polymerase sigma-70 factor (ECF subfamily)